MIFVYKYEMYYISNDAFVAYMSDSHLCVCLTSDHWHYVTDREDSNFQNMAL
jgi:hypothetical protein